MHPATTTTQRRTERLLKRLAVVLAIAACALIVGIRVVPGLRARHQLARLGSDDSGDTLAAANVLALLAQDRPELLDDLVPALIRELSSPHDRTRRLARRIAVWTVLEVQGAGARWSSTLDTATDAQFLLIASVLRQAGRWNEQHEPIEHLAMREAIRARIGLPSEQAQAFLALRSCGPRACELSVEVILGGVESPDDNVAIAALFCAALCAGDAFDQAVETAAISTSPIVRRQAALMIGSMAPPLGQSSFLCSEPRASARANSPDSNDVRQTEDRYSETESAPGHQTAGQSSPDLVEPPHQAADKTPLPHTSTPRVPRFDLIAKLLEDVDAGVREAAAWAAGRIASADLAGPIEHVASADPVETVRAMAIWTIGHVLERSQLLCNEPLALARANSPDSADVPPAENRYAQTESALGKQETAQSLLLRSLGDDNPTIASRTLVAIGRARLALDDIAPLLACLDSGEPHKTVAAAFALSRAQLLAPQRDVAIDHLRALLIRSLRQGDGPSAAAAMDALARLDDEPYATVLADVAASTQHAPMLRYAAAQALAELAPTDAGDMFLALLELDDPAVRDLAAFALARLDAPPIDLLAKGTGSGQAHYRAGCALALGACKAALPEAERDALIQAFSLRSDPDSDRWEPIEEIQGYYYCARLMLGDSTAREPMNAFLLNEHFSRVAVFGSLFLAGDRAALDLLLRPNGSIDAASLLWDARLADVMRPMLAGAPWARWFEDDAIRAWQLDRLRDHWSMHRWDRQPTGKAHAPNSTKTR